MGWIERLTLFLALAALVGAAFLAATSDPAPRPAPHAAELRALWAEYRIRAVGIQDYVERLYELYQGLKSRVLRLETGLDWLIRETGKASPLTWELTRPAGAEKE